MCDKKCFPLQLLVNYGFFFVCFFTKHFESSSWGSKIVKEVVCLVLDMLLLYYNNNTRHVMFLDCHTSSLAITL